LTVSEVAKVLGVDNQHVTNLVESGDLLAVDFRTSKPASAGRRTAKHKSFRRVLRIPVEACEDLINARKTV